MGLPVLIPPVLILPVLKGEPTVEFGNRTIRLNHGSRERRTHPTNESLGA